MLVSLNEWEKIVSEMGINNKDQIINFSEKVLISDHDNYFGIIGCYFFKNLYYFTNHVWGVHDGGETQFLIDDEIKGVLPLPNRIVGFDSNLLHRATSFRDNHRFTLAAKFSSLPTEILKEKYPFLY